MGPDRGDPADVSLVQALLTGSQDALATLYDRHADAIHATVCRLTADRSIAEEIVQETFLALWDRADSFDPGRGSLIAWLHAIARNRTIDRLRSVGRRPATMPLSAIGGPDRGDGGAWSNPGDALDAALSAGDLLAASMPPRTPETAAALGELRAALQQALAAMPEEERMVIVLAYAEDLTQVEIAERLGLPLGTVKTRTRRALRRLRNVLGDEDAPESRRHVSPSARDVVMVSDEGS